MSNDSPDKPLTNRGKATTVLLLVVGFTVWIGVDLASVPLPIVHSDFTFPPRKDAPRDWRGLSRGDRDRIERQNDLLKLELQDAWAWRLHNREAAYARLQELRNRYARPRKGTTRWSRERVEEGVTWIDQGGGSARVVDVYPHRSWSSEPEVHGE